MSILDGIELRSSEHARRFQVRPVREEEGEDEAGENYITCTPAEAELWGVYYQHDGCPAWNSLVDFDTEAEALEAAFMLAKGRAVYQFDTAAGERLAKLEG